MFITIPKWGRKGGSMSLSPHSITAFETVAKGKTRIYTYAHDAFPADKKPLYTSLSVEQLARKIEKAKEEEEKKRAKAMKDMDAPVG